MPTAPLDPPLVTLMCCSDDVILGIGVGIGYASWYRSNPSTSTDSSFYTHTHKHSTQYSTDGRRKATTRSITDRLTSIGYRTFPVAGACIWNTLPLHVTLDFLH